MVFIPNTPKWLQAETLKVCGELLVADETAFEKALRVGELLNLARSHYQKKGEWGQYLKTFPLSKATLNNYMKLANNKEDLIRLNVRRLAKAYNWLYTGNAEGTDCSEQSDDDSTDDTTTSSSSSEQQSESQAASEPPQLKSSGGEATTAPASTAATGPAAITTNQKKVVKKPVPLPQPLPGSDASEMVDLTVPIPRSAKLSIEEKLNKIVELRHLTQRYEALSHAIDLAYKKEIENESDSSDDNGTGGVASEAA